MKIRICREFENCCLVDHFLNIFSEYIGDSLTCLLCSNLVDAYTIISIIIWNTQGNNYLLKIVLFLIGFILNHKPDPPPFLHLWSGFHIWSPALVSEAPTVRCNTSSDLVKSSVGKGLSDNGYMFILKGVFGMSHRLRPDLFTTSVHSALESALIWNLDHPHRCLPTHTAVATRIG
jgi:hypothetical protein